MLVVSSTLSERLGFGMVFTMSQAFLSHVHSHFSKYCI